MFFYLFICLLFFGIGDFLSVLTKAKVSSVFVSLLLFLIAFITGIIPPDIIKQAGLADFGKWAILFIVFSLGTTINLRELIDEWRTLAVSFIAMALVVVTGFALIPVIGKKVGDTAEFGGLLGYAPIIPVNTFSCEKFVTRGGRIPAPIHSFKN